MPLGWRNWAIFLEPIEGIVLGSRAGFSAAFAGSLIARIIKPIDVWMFGIIAEPMGVLACALLANQRWKPVMIIYAFMLTAYFVHPLGRSLPLWTILDILVAFALIYPTARIARTLFGQNIKRQAVSLVLVSFIGTVTDALTRVFLLIPGGLYMFLGWPPDVVYVSFVTGAVGSYVEDALVVITSFLVGVPLLVTLRRISTIKPKGE